jgi:hypothetical protein
VLGCSPVATFQDCPCNPPTIQPGGQSPPSPPALLFCCEPCWRVPPMDDPDLFCYMAIGANGKHHQITSEPKSSNKADGL